MWLRVIIMRHGKGTVALAQSVRFSNWSGSALTLLSNSALKLSSQHILSGIHELFSDIRLASKIVLLSFKLN